MNLKAKAVNGVKWSALEQLIAQASSFIFGILLMRILTPDDYGLIAMVMFFGGILNIFQDFGLTTSLIQKKNITEDDKQVVFWTMLILSFLLASILFITSDLIAEFYEEPKVAFIAKIFSVNFCFAAIGTIDSAIFRRQMMFKPMAILQSSGVIMGGVVALILANFGYGYWALLAQTLIVTATVNFGMYVWGGFRPSLHFSWSALKHHINFGLPLFGSRATVYFSKNTDKLLVGKFLAKSDLGIYTRAYNLIYLPIHQISMVFTGVLYSSFATIQDDKQKIFRGYSFISLVLLYSAAPFLAIFYFNTDIIVLTIFGDKWIEIIPLMKIFMFLVIFHILAVFRGSVNLSLGHTNQDFKFNLITSVIDITAITIGVFIGLTQVALFLVFSAAIKAIISLYLVSYSTEKPFFQTLSSYKGAMICFILTFGVCFLLSSWNGSDLIKILLQISTSIIITFIVLFQFDNWVLKELGKVSGIKAFKS